MTNRTTIIALAILAMPAPGAAQATGSMSMPYDAHASQAAFRVGDTRGWTIGAPHIDLNGGYFLLPEKDGTPKLQTGFVNVRAQAGLGTQHVQLAANAIFVPRIGGSPQFTTVLQIVPTRQEQLVHFSVGAGMVSGAFGSSDRANAWVESVLALRLPVHGIAPFVQVGVPLYDDARAQIMIGAAHPLMPYRFKLWHR